MSGGYASLLAVWLGGASAAPAAPADFVEAADAIDVGEMVRVVRIEWQRDVAMNEWVRTVPITRAGDRGVVMNNQLVERHVGASAYLTATLEKLLAAGQTVAAATWSTSDTDLATVVGATSAISSNGRAVSAKLSHVAAGLVRVTIDLTLQNPAETIPVWIPVRQVDAPTLPS